MGHGCLEVMDGPLAVARRSVSAIDVLAVMK